ncbi:phosphotriesterase [Malacoplasma penetrans]|uniref:phospho-furanose lactonase n=1 Tax=Malacoplasma penetrans TaxID=28227 RepID=UPI00101096D2|nr:phosphotriesterase [Malacoplasma penetrans]RXY96572.1 phosphotriesterase [Malacoplasma penetrans]
MSKFVRTILGDIDPSQLGITDCHDHLIKNGGPESHEHPDFILLSVDTAIKELESYHRLGGRSMCIMDPPNIGRDVVKTLQIAEALRGKVNLIMCTGFHKAAFYDKYSSWLAEVPIDEIVKLTVAEVNEGMDLYNYNGPYVKRGPAKAGMIKAGTGYAAIDKLEFKALEIAARTSIETGCPILVHTQLGTMAYEAAKYMIDFGANPRKIQLSHLNKNPDKYYYEKIISELGVTICFDGPDRVKYYPDSTLAENLKWLVDRGYSKNITLALDAGRILYQENYGIEKGKLTFGFPYLFERFIPLLKKVGVKSEHLADMLINNPREILTFDEPRTFNPHLVKESALEIKRKLNVK